MKVNLFIISPIIIDLFLSIKVSVIGGSILTVSIVIVFLSPISIS